MRRRDTEAPINHPQQNQLLAALPPAELTRLNLQLTSLPLGKVLHEPGQAQAYTYFPVDCIVSLIFRTDDAMRSLLLRYTQALITQMAQTAVCNCHHSVDQQLCRWLLLSLDRLPSNQLVMTQELIANMLGVRREGVTEAAGKLEKLGVIRYARGRITVLNRSTLEQLCCECYAVVKRETDRLRPLPYGSQTEGLPPVAAVDT
jgi:hypothetical protein